MSKYGEETYMKSKRAFFAAAPLLGLLLLGALPWTKSRPVAEINAYAPSALPTRISLKDATEAEVRSYYGALSSLPESALKGDELLKHLKPILKNNQQYWSYESGANIWKMYEITDRDWQKSPASAIPGYDPATQEIVGYTYGSSNSSPGPTDPYVRALYVNRDVDNQSKAWGNHNQNQWGINREHIWPKSQGFTSEGAGGARGDPMHLWPGNGRVNGTEHGNSPYGFVDLEKAYTDPVSSKGWTNLSGNYAGTSSTLSSGTKVFEPQDSDKGDIARAVFYMAARYQFLDRDDKDPLSVDNPNLRLVQEGRAEASYDSSLDKPGTLGVLSDLLAWNRLDPPDEFEIHRNNLLYRNFTGNRNPFIDFPSWAEAIWGSVVYEGREFISHDAQDVFPVDPVSDALYAFVPPEKEALTLSSTSLSLRQGETGSIVATSRGGAPIAWSATGDALRLHSAETASGEPLRFLANSVGEAEIVASSRVEGRPVEARATVTVLPKEGAEEGYLKLSASEMELRVGDRAAISAVSSSGGRIRYAVEGGGIALDAKETASGEMLSFYAEKEGNAVIRATTTIHGKEVQSSLLLRVIPAPSPSLIEAPVSASDRLDVVSFPVEGTAYGTVENVSFPDSGAAYSACLANHAGTLQLNVSDTGKKRYPGFVMTAGKGEVQKVRFAFDAKTAEGRSVALYGKNAPYSSPKDLFDLTLRGERIGVAVAGNGVVEIPVTGGYRYIGFAAENGALYLQNVEVVHAVEIPVSSISVSQKDVLRPGDYIRRGAFDVIDQRGRPLYPFEVLLPSGESALNRRLTYEEVAAGEKGTAFPCLVRYLTKDGRTLEASLEARAQRRSGSLEIRDALGLADSLMEAEVSGQCQERYPSAKAAFEALDQQERALFMESKDPLFVSAKSRLIAWANFHGETLLAAEGGYAFSRAKGLPSRFGNELATPALIVLALGLAGVVCLPLFRRRRKR